MAAGPQKESAGDHEEGASADNSDVKDPGASDRPDVDSVEVAKTLPVPADYTPEPEDDSSPVFPRIPGFRVEKRLGEGGLGAVYGAWDLNLERMVALKVLKHGTSDSVRGRVIAEARKSAALQNASIATVYSVSEEGDAPAIVMEYVEGFTLDKVAAPLTYHQKAKLLLAVIKALAVAHGKGVIHRDLKPDNILVTPMLEPKIVDFGLAISVHAERQHSEFEGTPCYASPEQAVGSSLTPSSDIFSFGSVMFEVLTGQAPFFGASAQDILDNIQTADPPFPRTLKADVPEDLQLICLSCMTREAEKRPSADEVAADLSRYLAGEPARLRPASYGDILHRHISSHMGEIAEWKQQGMVSKTEGDRLSAVYRRILADEDHWIIDARRLSLPQTLLYSGTWAAVVGIVLLVWLGRSELSSVQRWLLPCVGWMCLLAAGWWAHKRKDVLASASFLAGAILATVPALLAILSEASWLASRPKGISQLLPPPYSNHQLALASLAALTFSALAHWFIRLTAFAWTTAFTSTATFLSVLIVFGWLDEPPEDKALWCLPLLLAELCAQRFEKVRQFRWALPFHLIALLTLVLAFDVMAFAGPTLQMIGLESWFKEPSLIPFSLAANGVLMFVLMIFMETSSSLDLRRGSSLLEILVPIHLLGPLYWNAQLQKGWPDVSLYIVCVLLLLAMAPWRSRGRFLIAGFLGVAFGSYLLIDLDFVPRAGFPIVLGVSGLLMGVITWGWLRYRA